MRRTVTGVDYLNEVLQASLNPPSEGKPELRMGGWRLRVGDKVMQTRNNYDKAVFNGDVGRVEDIDEETGEVWVRFPQPEGPELVRYEAAEADELTLAYCITVHKSQGSEYPAVILPLTTQHYMMLQRNLLYTVTRAKRLVVIVGSRRALRMALDGVSDRQAQPAAARNRGGGDGSMRGPSGRPAALLGHKGLVVLFAVLIVLAVPAWSGPWDGPWDGPWNGPWIGPGSGWWSGAGTARAQGLQFGVHVAGEAGSFWWHLPLAASLGAGMAPLEFRWDLVEPVPGRFEWARFDAAVEAARASGMRLVGVLHYPAGLPPLSRMSRPGWPSAHVDDWDYFVERVASRYGGEMEDWIVVRGRAGRRDPILGAAEADLDAQLVRTTAAALKRTQPRARRLASVPGADLRWLEVFMARGGLAEVDGLALEVNRWPAGPEGLERVIADVRALAAAAGKLDALSPVATLARGYAVARRADTGQVVRRGGQVAAGDELLIRVVDAELTASVKAVAPAPELAADAAGG